MKISLVYFSGGSRGNFAADPMYMAEAGLNQWIGYLADKKQEIPAASDVDEVKANMGGFVNLVRVELKDEDEVRRTVSIPHF